MSFHQLCSWRIKQASINGGRNILTEVEMEYPSEDKFDVHYPCGLALSSEILQDKFDAVVVDEGQDFKDTYWLALSYLLKDEEKSPFFIFLDQNQSIYSVEMEDIPIKDEPFFLTFNCRNTKYIHDSAYRFFNGQKVDSPHKNKGSPIRKIEANTLQEQLNNIREEISKLLAFEGVKENQVAILVGSKNKKIYYDYLSTTKLPTGYKWNVEGPAESSGVRVNTIRKFKGLEADIIYIWGIEEIDLPRDEEILYVGISRAKSRLIIVGTRLSCAQFLSYKS